MDENKQDKVIKRQKRYARLDKYLLYLLTAELGYFILLMIAGIVVTFLVYVMDLYPDYYDYVTSILWPVAIYIVALPLNMLGGLLSIILNIRSNHQGYPGTGHLLNWIFLMTTGWLFIAALVFMMPSMARTY
jgi:hypothetical protein